MTLLLLFLFSFLPTPTYAQDITSDLVGHWTLDETSGSTLSDSSGNSNDMTWSDSDDNDVSGETTTGQINTAIHFDDTNDYATDSSIDLSGTDAVTIALWVNRTWSDEGGNTLFEFSTNTNSTTTGFGLFPDENTVCASTGEILILARGNTGRNRKCYTQPSSGAWHHLTLVLDKSQSGASEITLYIDGVEQSYTSMPYSSDNNNNFADNPFFLSTRDGTQEFNENIIDDVRIYSRALTATDVATLYSYTGNSCSDPSGLPGEITYNEDDNILQYCNGANWVAIGPSSNLTDGLVGYWKLDETSGSTITDSSGSGNDLTWVDNDDNDVSGETTTGQIDNALHFDATDDYATDSSIDLSSTDVVTVALWVNRTWSDEGGNTLFEFSSNVNSTSTGFGLFPDDAYFDPSGRILVGLRGNSYFNVKIFPQPSSNVWHHIVAIFDKGQPASSEVTFYIDGVEQTPISAPISYDNTNNFGNNPFFLSSRAGTSEFNENIMDDVRLYNRALSPFEIQSLYDMGASCTEPDSTNLAGHWTLDETSSNTIADSSGNSNTGTWTDSDDEDVNGETVTGMDGTALTFDGIDDYITVPDDTSIDITGDITASAWVYLEDVPPSSGTQAYPRILQKGYAAQSSTAYILGLNDTPHATFTVYQSNTPYEVEASTTLSVQTWYHITGVRHGESLEIYIDGVLDNTATGPSGSIDDEGNLYFGESPGNTDGVFEGALDDVRIYSSALSNNEVASLYGSVGGTCSISACASPAGRKGEIVFNTDYHLMQYCNGGSWIAMGPVSDGGAACTSPAGYAGTLRFNADNSTLMYCEGDEWVTVIGENRNVSTSTDPCNSTYSPTVGTVCSDGTRYAGDTPDGNVQMYTTPCDSSAYWDGSSCISLSGSGHWTGSGSSYTTTYGISYGIRWSVSGTIATGYTSTITGQANTAALAALSNADSPYYATQYCENLTAYGHSDWYLPATDEIYILYTNRTAIGNFNGEYYWPSTEYSASNARNLRFTTGIATSYTKTYPNAIRCVRHD